MKMLIAALLATSAVAAAGPASAQRYDGGQYSDWDRGGQSRFAQQFDHAYEGIQHGVEDGSYTRWEAQQLYGQVRELRRRLAYYQRNDGRLDGRERRDLEWRLQRLHQVMHDAHEDGHEQVDEHDSNDDHNDDRR